MDAIIVGSYYISASINITGEFENQDFSATMGRIIKICNKYKVPCGDHIVKPDIAKLKMRISEGYRFIAYATDAVFLYSLSSNPLNQNNE